MVQQGQVLPMKSSAADGRALGRIGIESAPRLAACAARRFRIRAGRGGGARAGVERLRRANGTASTLTLAELVAEYLAQHDAQPETIEKLRGCLLKRSEHSASGVSGSSAHRRSRPGG
jgi:hypothetical protein